MFNMFKQIIKLLVLILISFLEVLLACLLDPNKLIQTHIMHTFVLLVNNLFIILFSSSWSFRGGAS